METNGITETFSGIVETTTVKKIRKLLNGTSKRAQFSFIFGQTGRGKTFAAREWLARNDGGYIRVQTGDTLNRLRRQVSYRLFNHDHAGNREIIEYLARRPGYVLIVDEAALLLHDGAWATRSKNINFFRDLFDGVNDNGGSCGVCFIFTDCSLSMFEGGSKALEQAIGRVVTDSKLPGEPKDPQSTSLTRIYEAFATREDYEAFCQELRDGLGWGDAKKKLIDKINAEIGPMREKYEYYVSHPAELEAILQAGAAKARKIASPFIEELRHAVGLRSFTLLRAEEPKAEIKTSAKPPLRSYGQGSVFYGCQLLIISSLYLKETLRMVAYGANFRSFGTYYDMAAVTANPYTIALT